MGYWLLALLASVLSARAGAQDLSGLWEVTVGEHRQPSGRLVPATKAIRIFESFGSDLTLHATRAYPDAKVHSGLVRASSLIVLSADDVGLREFPEFVGTQWETHFIGWLSPDGRQIDGRDQHIGATRYNVEGQLAARAVRYTIPVTMRKLDVELGFIRAGARDGEFVRSIAAGDEFRLLARFAEPIAVTQLEAQLAAGAAEKVLLRQDNADARLFWSERIFAAPAAAATGYVALLGPLQADLAVRGTLNESVRGFCPRFLYDTVIEDYEGGTVQQCARPSLPGALRGDGGAEATGRSIVRFERELRSQSTLSWDLPQDVRIASTCPAVGGRTADEDAWLRMRMATEYLVARRRLVDGIMSGLESLASLDALGAMQCERGPSLGVSSGARLLAGVDCASLSGVPGGADACRRLQTQCPAQQSFSGLVDQTDIALRQSEAVNTALQALAGQSGAEAERKRKQLEWAQSMSGSMNPWLEGKYFKEAYAAALDKCRRTPSAGAGFCEDFHRDFVCQGMKQQVLATAATVRRQIEKFSQALVCIENSQSECSLSSEEFRRVVRSAPEMRRVPAPKAAAPEDRGLAGFVEFMVADIDCRAEMQEIAAEERAAIRDFAVGAALTVATAGIGSVAARVAMTASRARAAGMTVEAARAASVSTRLQRAALAIDVLDAGYGIADGVAQCNDVFKESSAIPPLNTAGPQCPAPDQYAGPQLTEHYRSCVTRTVALGLATAGLVALPAGVSRAMDESALRRAGEALRMPDASRFSTAQREALLQVFRSRLAGSTGEGLEAADAVLKQARFSDAQIRDLFLKLAPDVRQLGTKLVQGLEGDVVRQIRVGDHTLTITQVKGRAQIFRCSLCRRLASATAGAQLDARTLNDLAEIGTRMGLDRANRPETLMQAYENVIRFAADAPDPARFIAAVKRAPPETLTRTGELLASPALATALKVRPQRATAFFDQLATQGESALTLFTRLPRADAAARDIGDLIDLATVSSDAWAGIARLAAGHDSSAVMTMARACADLSRRAPRGEARDWANRMIRLAEEVSAAGPAVGSERRAWATMTDVAVAHERLGSAKFADYLDAIDFFRRADGHTPGIIRNARARETANLQDVVSGDLGNPVHNALELVGTKWLVEKGTRIKILAGRTDRGLQAELPALTKDNVAGFGAREIRTPGTTRTIEADTALSFTPGQAGGTMNIVLDWKNYDELGELKASDILKAIEALDSGAVKNVLFVSPRPWSQATIDRIARLSANRPGLMLASIEPDEFLRRFLDEPLP